MSSTNQCSCVSNVQLRSKQEREKKKTIARENEKKKEKKKNNKYLVTHHTFHKKVHIRMTGFSRSLVSSFPRQFLKSALKRLGTGRVQAHAQAIHYVFSIYAQVDIGKSVQVERLGTGSKDREGLFACWEEFRDVNKYIKTSRHHEVSSQLDWQNV